MTDIVVSDDQDFKRTVEAQELAQRIGTWLATTYPGYRWRIEPYPHPTRPFVDVRLEAGHCMVGWTIQPWRHYSDSSLKAYTIRVGGELLERYGLNRRALDEAEFVSRKKNFAGLVMPEL